MNLDRKKDRSAAIQQSLLNGGTLYPLSFFDSRTYVQHNPLIENGLGPILKFMDELPPDRRSVKTCRSIEDGDFSVVHNDYQLGDWGIMAAFEVHRWEDDRIVEHWDNLQAIPVEPNPSGRTMTDGAWQVTDHEKTAANKALTERFTRDVLIGNDRQWSSFFAGDALIQHNPRLRDGVQALRQELEQQTAIYQDVHRLIGEGNFVLAMSEGILRNSEGQMQPAAFYDLYRLAGGVIVEHWDVVEAIAPRDQWRNTNGKF